MATLPLTITLISAPSKAFPGQPGNPVGFAAAPGYPGFLTPHGTGGWASNTTYSFLDIDAGSFGAFIGSGVTNVTFMGCRFQSNSVGNSAMQLGVNPTNGPGAVMFLYCSFTPRVSIAAAPPGSAWPSAGAGKQTITQVTGVNCIGATQGYQYGVNCYGGGPLLFDSCDFWGFGNGGPLFYQGTTAKITVRNCWIHDCANGDGGYHQDGTGYVNGPNGTPPTNIELIGNTIASIGNTQGIAWQGSTIPYANILMQGNFISGFGYTTAFGGNKINGMNNTTFINNVFGTDLPWVYGPIYDDYSAMFRSLGNRWSGNKLRVLPGTSPWPGSTTPFTLANDGQFLWPDRTLHTTDFS